MFIRRLRGVMPLVVVTVLLGASAAWADSTLPTGEHGLVDQQTTRNIIPEPGFFIQPWAVVPAPTALDWSPDGRLFVTSAGGDVFSFKETAADSYHWLGQPGTQRFATGLTQPLGLAISSDSTQIFVADSHAVNGVTVGRVQVFTDASPHDGVADGAGQVVVDGLPQGRHNTNDMAINPVDGMLYITNGNQTDHGEGTCGAPPAVCESPYSGVLFRTPVTSRNLGPAGLEVVARRMRNIYDVAFWPGDPTKAFVPMNGSDDPASDDVLYKFDTANVKTITTTSSSTSTVHKGNGNPVDPSKIHGNNSITTTSTSTSTSTVPIIEDAGFPLCMYSPHANPTVPAINPSDPTANPHHGHGASLEPSDNPVYGPGACPKADITKPVASFGGHMSADGLDFARGGAFNCFSNAAATPPVKPCTYRNDLYVAEWGDLWGGAGKKSGHKVVRVDMRDDGTIPLDHDGMPVVKDFITGGAPIDVAFRPNEGAMYVADMGGFIYKVFRHTGTESGPPDPADGEMHPGHGGKVDEHVLLDGGSAVGTSLEGHRFVIREYDTNGDGVVDHSALGYDGPGEGEMHMDNANCKPTPAEQAYANALVTASKQAAKMYDGWAGAALAKRHNFWPYPVTESKLIHMASTTRGSIGATNPYQGLWDPANPGADEKPANIAPPFDELSEGYYYENSPHVLNPWRMESFVYAMVDDWDGDASNGKEAGPKVVNAMFEFPYLLDTAGKLIPPPNPTGCLMMWHNHSGAAGLATSFSTSNPDQSAWMAHVYVLKGLDPWMGPTTPGEGHEWFGPFKVLPATCFFDSGCIP